MHDPAALIVHFIMSALLLLVPLYLATRIFPTTCRVTRRLARALAGPLLLTQAKRRGWLHALAVHLPTLSTVILTLIALLSGTWGLFIPALLCVAFALTAKRALGALHRLRSHRSRLPSWR